MKGVAGPSRLHVKMQFLELYLTVRAKLLLCLLNCMLQPFSLVVWQLLLWNSFEEWLDMDKQTAHIQMTMWTELIVCWAWWSELTFKIHHAFFSILVISPYKHLNIFLCFHLCISTDFETLYICFSGAPLLSPILIYLLFLLVTSKTFFMPFALAIFAFAASARLVLLCKESVVSTGVALFHGLTICTTWCNGSNGE